MIPLKVVISAGVLALIGVGALFLQQAPIAETPRFSDIEAGFESEEEFALEAPLEEPIPPPLPQVGAGGRVSGWALYWQDFSESEKRYYDAWKRPAGPLRVGVQVGHWKNEEVPDELSGLTRNGGGAQGGGMSEVDVVLIIAEKVKALLEAEGIIVDLLPATVPVDYYADAFVSIHADGNNSPAVSGFKISGPRRDFSGKADQLVSVLYETYAEATGLKEDANVTRRMSSYYAFNWRRYDHALHPFTPAAIVETGFLTSPSDREVIVGHSDDAARGIAEGILRFLRP